MMNQTKGPHQGQPVLTAGESLENATVAVVLLHGRGATARDILTLAPELTAPGIAFLAPQAAGNTWYPISAFQPLERNEPYLSSALQAVTDVVERAKAAGIPQERIVIAGFSQGACLASEWVARHAQRYGGLIVFSGALIGPLGQERHDSGSLDGMPVFIGSSDPDPWMPIAHVHETERVLSALGANVNKQVYPNMGHTIIPDEFQHARTLLQTVAQPAERS